MNNADTRADALPLRCEQRTRRRHQPRHVDQSHRLLHPTRNGRPRPDHRYDRRYEDRQHQPAIQLYAELVATRPGGGFAFEEKTGVLRHVWVTETRPDRSSFTFRLFGWSRRKK